MKKLLFLLLTFAMIFALAACNSNEVDSDEFFSSVTFTDLTTNFNGSEQSITVKGTIPEGTEIKYNNNVGTNEGEYNATATLTNGKYSKTLKANLKIVEPTATQVVAARANAVSQDIQGFDYRYRLAGELAVLGFSGGVEGVYNGNYRENKNTGDTVFKRTTSGALLFDSEIYSYRKGNTFIKMKMDDDGSVKKIYTETIDEQDTFFIHKPIEILVNSIEASEISNIAISSEIPGYKYKALVKFNSNKPAVNGVLSAVSKLGTTISIKGVEIPNIANGITMYFNYDSGDKINDFYINLDLSFSVKAADVNISLSYEQNGNNTNISLPESKDFTVEENEIINKIQAINNSMLAVKDDNSYSIDVSAVNDFDPSATKLAIVDKYNARLYKNTVGTDIFFNHSYEYKSHHEEDGAETYKYTIGNVTGDEAGVYIVSRKGTNSVSAAENNYTADTQFDYLTGMALIDPQFVDCIKTVLKGDEVVYKIYINKQSVLNLQNRIINIINSNDAEGVIDVNNHFNNDNYTLEEGLIEVTLKNDTVTSINCMTEIRYNPTAGDYTEYNVELKNSIEIEINENLDKALEYTAPNSTGTILGIGAAKYYIK